MAGHDIFSPLVFGDAFDFNAVVSVIIDVLFGYLAVEPDHVRKLNELSVFGIAPFQPGVITHPVRD